jgi:hypothetical protein
MASAGISGGQRKMAAWQSGISNGNIGVSASSSRKIGENGGSVTQWRRRNAASSENVGESSWLAMAWQ